MSDLHCSIPMKGMVDSFNVSVAAGILMHHAVCDRISRTVIILILYFMSHSIVKSTLFCIVIALLLHLVCVFSEV